MSNLTYRITDAQVRALSWGGIEIARRIFVTVRDRQWREVPPTRWSTDDAKSGTPTITARHQSDLVDFEWEGILHNSQARPEIDLAIRGWALRDMEVCRLGLVLLHPVDLLVGTVVRSMGPAGVREIEISRQIHPQIAIDGVLTGMLPPFSELSMSLPDSRHVSFQFEGELFELEDQRNWGDTSFKSYCTPLCLPFPRRISKGTLIEQRVVICVSESARDPEHSPIPAETVASASAHAPRRPQNGSQGQSDAIRFPTLGCSSATSGVAVCKGSAAVWQGVRLDVADTASLAMAESALAAIPPTTKIELGTTVSSAGVAPAVAELIRAYESRFSALIVRDSVAPLPSSAAIAAAKAQLRTTTANITLLVEPIGYFVEYNRGTPLDVEADGVAFPLCTTVHAHDLATIVENVPAIVDMVLTVRRLMRNPTIHISPLALHVPPLAVTRFPQDLVAAWLVATLTRIAALGISAVMLADDVIGALWSSIPGRRLLGQIVGLSDRELLRSEAVGDSGVHLLAVRAPGDAADVFIANISPEPITVNVRGDGSLTRVEPRSVVVSQTSAASATSFAL